ncbi:MAG: NAD(P)/FAD-dependent oxidoreductase, partial [Rhodomicrobium sp.]
AGAHLLWRTPFVGAERQGGVFTFSGVNISARHILGADGARSAVARQFGLGRNRRFLAAIEVQFDELEGADTRFLHCFLDSRIAPGHIAWVVPGPSAFHAGLAAAPGRRPHLKAFLKKSEPIFGFAAANAIGRTRGRIPCGGLVKPWAIPGVTLIGDAAGMASPVTGGGLRYALRFGRRSAQLVADHLLHFGPPPEIALARELPDFAPDHAMRFGLNLAPPNSLLSAAFSTPAIRWIAQHIYFRSRGGQGVSFADFEARLARLESKDGAAATSVFR